MNEQIVINDMKKSLNESAETNIDFKNAEFDWNDLAKSFETLRFTISTDDGDIEIDDFDAWLQKNFPKEYKVLRMLSNKELNGSGFEYYVIDCMMEERTYGKAGIYPAPHIPLIRFCDAKSL